MALGGLGSTGAPWSSGLWDTRSPPPVPGTAQCWTQNPVCEGACSREQLCRGQRTHRAAAE